jgi:hypothetical protein
MDWIMNLLTPLGTTLIYSAVTDLRSLQFTVAHTLEFSVFTSHILATDCKTVIISVSL